MIYILEYNPIPSDYKAAYYMPNMYEVLYDAEQAVETFRRAGYKGKFRILNFHKPKVEKEFT